MPRMTFASEHKAKTVLKEIRECVYRVARGEPLRAVARLAQQKNARSIISRSFLQRAVLKPLPTIAKSRSNFYLQWADSKNYMTFTDKEESALLGKIKCELESKPFLSIVDVQEIAKTFRDEVIKGANRKNQIRLAKTSFKHHWVCEFMKRHKKSLSHLMSRPVDLVRVMAFNGVTLSNFFAQVQQAFETYGITSASQVLNLDETGFTPGRDMNGLAPERLITNAKCRAVWSRLSFRYENRISLLLCVGADGQEYAPAAVFKGVREPTLTEFLTPTKVSKLMPPGWNCFWRRDVASVDSNIFKKWAHKFVADVRARNDNERWMILFYDACRSHMTTAAIDVFRAANIAVMALPAHTSDRLQPLDVSVFGPLRHFVNTSLTHMALEAKTLYRTQQKLSGGEVWRAIVAGHAKAFTPNNIKSGFLKCGLWPLNINILVSDGVRASQATESTVSESEVLNEVRRLYLSFRRWGPPDPMPRSGFIDTTLGIELTRTDVYDVLKALELDRKERAKQKERDNDILRTEEIAAKDRKRVFAENIECSKALDRSKRHGLPFKLPRTYKERRLTIKKILEMRRAERIASQLREEEPRCP